MDIEEEMECHTLLQFVFFLSDGCSAGLDAFRLFFKLVMQQAFYNQLKFHVAWMLIRLGCDQFFL